MGIIALVGLASLSIGWLMIFILPGIHLFAWGIIACGVGLIVLAGIIDFRRFSTALGSRRGKLGLSATVRISLFIGILLIANAISVDYYHRFDFTGLAQFTLTSNTKDMLAMLDEPVEIVSFFTPRIPVTIRNYAKSLLNEYQNYSDRLTVRDIDPDLHPDQARQYGVDTIGAIYGVVVFRSGDGRRQVFGPQIASEAEHAFTSAILEVSGVKQKKIYFLTGHGESSIYSGYSSARTSLQDNLFQVQELDLMVTPRVPEDSAVVVIAGPQQPLADSEFEIIRTYLNEDGRLLLLLNPNPPLSWQELVAEWGVEFQKGMLIDPASHVAPDQDNILVPRTRNSFGLSETHFPGATAVIPKQDKTDDIVLNALVWTSQEAWMEQEDMVADEEPIFNTPPDRKGPFATGVVISLLSERQEDQSNLTAERDDIPGEKRLIVYGDSDFAANYSFYNGNNSDLFLTSVSWLAADMEIISVDRKVLAARRLLLDPEEARFLHVSSIGLLPLLLVVAGIYVWWRRRQT